MQVHEATLFTLSPTVAAHFSSLTRASTARGRSTTKHQQHQQQQTGGTLSYRRVPLLPTVFYGYPLPAQPQSQRSLLSPVDPSPSTRRHSCSLIWLQSGAHHRAASSIQSSSSPCSTLNTTNPNFFASPFCASTSSAAHSSAASSSSSSYSAHSSSFSSANHSSSITTTHSNTLHATTTNTFATATNTANTASWIRNFDVVLTKRNSAHLSPSSSSVPLENYLYG
ncbi:hypothetical protein TYRP_002714 [Tyrophagus putrescentiae]|nr:hypothetical protein TYRP_002714 [Tyrophagus putrescentiae]